ncbi:hypothetical protein CHUAL_006809 [Chamberlinius hualienensis]
MAVSSSTAFCFFILTLAIVSVNCYHLSSNYVNNDNAELYQKIATLLQQRNNYDLERQQETIQSVRPGIFTPTFVSTWPATPLPMLGQVAGVAVDPQNNLVIVHRGSHNFDGGSFDAQHFYARDRNHPIAVDAVLTINTTSGEIISGWGRNTFYLPHGLTVDKEGNIWITDVALHQVFKFPRGSNKPSLVFGEAFVPGSDDKHFCKPTDVAVASTGEFFITDGYCNSRIQKYSKDGRLLAKWGHTGERSIFAIPHSLALLEDQDLICVADRENQRVQCFSAGLNRDSHGEGGLYPLVGEAGKFIYEVSTRSLGRVYAIAYGGDGVLYGVALGTENKGIGFTADMESGDIVKTWNNDESFGIAHDIDVAPDGRSLYVVEIEPSRVSKFSLQ